ncbi:DUF309 domain-containing protein [Telmatocola sphagniphila]|uniref:DUF309 domain-containing protein n=1 Tax=Telmatocola sphagniphila TaxID=1123043 RepID=A0A8E6BCR4_9BACT|nr:DUF309 domain-containing protein [Telmatocola sphagniphila]QVL34505.1 DUF309 domain-containing protein [Telmatocola sphagniphila]
MKSNANQYDTRYLEGIDLFNSGDFFAAHEIWEELWTDCDANVRRFYQSLIHASVAVYHCLRGNNVGASRLLASGSRYAKLYPNPFLGFRHQEFWAALETCLASADSDGNLDRERIPKIELTLLD